MRITLLILFLTIVHIGYSADLGPTDLESIDKELGTLHISESVKRDEIILFANEFCPVCKKQINPNPGQGDHKNFCKDGLCRSDTPINDVPVWGLVVGVMMEALYVFGRTRKRKAIVEKGVNR